jgi:hypothetical protein
MVDKSSLDVIKQWLIETYRAASREIATCAFIEVPCDTEIDIQPQSSEASDQ